MPKKHSTAFVIFLFIFSITPNVISMYQEKVMFQTTNPNDWCTLSGYITDEYNNPINGVRVRISCGDEYLENFSDSNGYYLIDHIPVVFCIWNISAYKKGFETKWIDMPISENTTLDFKLSTIDIIYVDDDGGADYTKIQDAIDNSHDGGTIFVYSGDYIENIFANKPIKIIGENKKTTKIICGIDFDDKSNMIVITSNNVTIKNFTITNSYNISTEANGIGIFKSNDTIIENNIFNSTRFWWNSIYLNSSKFCKINDNIIEGKYWLNEEENDYNEFGISCINSENITINNNIIYYHYSTGIDICNSKNINISNNKIFENGYGINFWESTKSSIYKNQIQKGYMSSHIEACRDIIINKNIISNNEACGLFISNSNKIIIKENNITSNEGEGIHFTGNIHLKASIKYCYGNQVLKNNFINNKKNAYFYTSYQNKWDQNYWDDLKIKHYIIFGDIGPFPEVSRIKIPWINIDWHPAEEPYKIKNMYKY